MQVIRFTGVTKSYGKGAPALRDVSFSLKKGEFLFLTGPSGAGKSTLLKLIYMGTRPTEGEVRVSGYSSSKIHRREIPHLRRRLGVIFQDFRLLRSRTARENVAFALEVTGAPRSAIGPKVQRTLNAVGLGRKADRFPNELSGGEQQRVAIARALVNDPFILLADEPTGNLDTRTSLEILRILREINSLGMAVLLATHDSILLSDYPEARVLHLVEGNLVSDSANPAVGTAGSRAAAPQDAKPPVRPPSGAAPRVGASAPAPPAPPPRRARAEPIRERAAAESDLAQPTPPVEAASHRAHPTPPPTAESGPPRALPPAAAEGGLPRPGPSAAAEGRTPDSPSQPAAAESGLPDRPRPAPVENGPAAAPRRPAAVWTVDDLPSAPPPRQDAPAALPPRTGIAVPAPAGEPRLGPAPAGGPSERDKPRQPAGQARN